MGLFDFLKRKELEEIEKLKSDLKRFQPILDIEKEVNRKTEEVDKLIGDRTNELNVTIKEKNKDIEKSEGEIKELTEKYESSLETYKRLRKEVGVYESKVDLIDYGVYEPVYDFEKSDEYREEQKRMVSLQKEMIKDKTAAICPTKWTIDGSEAKGRASTNKIIKLVLRAFNGETNTMIAKVKWNNVNQMQERIHKSFDAINKLGENSTVSIQSEYLELKIKELILEHEFQLKKQQEKEELRAVQEQIREEEKARREYEKAEKDAEKEEKTYESALEKARKEIEKLTGDKHEKMLAQIAKLEEELTEAQAKKERALSMAQQTKRGHVYVISNIGSFGENVYKIGMTRRLEPNDRVKELGDASVPFRFDVHAMIFSDEAPTLEKELHKAFSEKQVNLINYRKEFFNVSLDEIETHIKEVGIDAEFTRLPEAIEYRETLALLEKMNSTEELKTIDQEIENEFPSSLN
jgi:hypothetical protein